MLNENYIVEVRSEHGAIATVYFERLSTALEYMSNTLQGAYQHDATQTVTCSIWKQKEVTEKEMP